ncbi:SycD/LcrH family type III secretion system chaperone [Vitiosangium sp. GDMCC 1.1324]|uniref:SycD/LcrH family type III secretion system chaperone n=1 Tax=Vitiosangium sp. (strain GDMCC 1.1324) TaxID=2138576 RepID=UPI000D3414C6|nr:SycD/LcrH family type III secretion system chaperone [Vitiosangium sp. GDMCC 1.1324]PTL80500.1 CesD/SycD/LcrH family type III secretion system chaperone [Vitiosangium sp. GDMCC 1.1324]
MAASDSNNPQQDEARLTALVQRWAEGKATLREVRGYSDEELYAIAKTAYFFYYQGRIAEARTLFQGLYAINPADAYFAKALGVVEMAAGNAQGALAAYDVALKLDARDAQAYVGRAEVRLTMGQKAQAVEDLRRAASLAPEEDPVARKANAMIDALSRR